MRVTIIFSYFQSKFHAKCKLPEIKNQLSEMSTIESHLKKEISLRFSEILSLRMKPI